jgi:leucyl aminopeptidase
VKIEFGAKAKRAGEITVCFCAQEERAKLTPPVTESEFSAQSGALLHLVSEGVLHAGVGERPHSSGRGGDAAAQDRAHALPRGT